MPNHLQPLVVSLAMLAACGDDSSSGGSGVGGAAAGGQGGGAASAVGGSSNGGGGAGAGTASGGAGGTAPIPTNPIVYVGNGDGQLQTYALDRDSGVLSPQSSFAVAGNPSFLAASPDKTRLYAVDENNSEVLAFAVEQASGALSELGQRQSSEGNGPAYVSVDATGNWVFVANYGGGTVAVLPVLADGSLGTAVDVESPGENAHAIRADASNSHVYVPCLGSDLVAQFDFDVATGELTPMPSDAALPAGTGPRHLEFHPSLPVVYVIGELGDTVTTFAVDSDGALESVGSVSTLPSGAAPDDNFCADLHIHPNGLHLYGSNRGHNSLAHFDVDAATGALTAMGHTATDGNWPRNFGIDPAGSLLLVANQQSNEVVAFALEPQTGVLSPLSTTVTGSSPSWVGVVPLPVQ